MSGVPIDWDAGPVLCSKCKRPIRPPKVEDAGRYAGTIRHGGRGLCQPCYRKRIAVSGAARKRRREDAARVRADALAAIMRPRPAWEQVDGVTYRWLYAIAHDDPREMGWHREQARRQADAAASAHGIDAVRVMDTEHVPGQGLLVTMRACQPEAVAA